MCIKILNKYFKNTVSRNCQVTSVEKKINSTTWEPWSKWLFSSDTHVWRIDY